jgi:hypothetical protein
VINQFVFSHGAFSSTKNMAITKFITYGEKASNRAHKEEAFVFLDYLATLTKIFFLNE